MPTYICASARGSLSTARSFCRRDFLRANRKDRSARKPKRADRRCDRRCRRLRFLPSQRNFARGRDNRAGVFQFVAIQIRIAIWIRDMTRSKERAIAFTVDRAASNHARVKHRNIANLRHGVGRLIESEGRIFISPRVVIPIDNCETRFFFFASRKSVVIAAPRLVARNAMERDRSIDNPRNTCRARPHERRVAND